MFLKKRKRRKIKLKFSWAKINILLIFATVIAGASLVISLLNQRFIPAVIEIANIKAQTNINQLLNDSIKNVTQELNLSSTDFYIKSPDNDGKINSFSANTILINDVCARIASDVSEQLSNAETQTIPIPVGALLGIEIFANSGPDYNVKILPKGNALVDYETEFISAGINQINFQIWLTVESKIQIVNPLQQEEFLVTRKIALVNTVINGEIPPAYIPALGIGRD